MMLYDTTPRNIERSDDDTTDPTAPFYEPQAFGSIWQALTWEQIRTRVPVCFSKTICSRYMLANLVYLVYAIGILIIDYTLTVNESSLTSDDAATNNSIITTTTTISPLDAPVNNVRLAIKLYIGFAVVHLISAFLYWWSWRDRSWLDIVMIPEYLNHIEAGLYLWSSIWYLREMTLGDFYTLSAHKIEVAAATVDLVASFGWIASWHLTYVRTLGRGFCLDDPDVIAFLTTTVASFITFVYSIQIHVHPEQYNTNNLYAYADILYFVGSCYYIFAVLRDNHWFWFLPLAGQYGVAPGKVQIETTKILPVSGKPVILMTDPCRQRRTKNDVESQKEENSDDRNKTITIIL